MSKIKSKDTKPELVVRKILYKLGYRFRLRLLYGKNFAVITLKITPLENNPSRFSAGIGICFIPDEIKIVENS